MYAHLRPQGATARELLGTDKLADSVIPSPQTELLTPIMKLQQNPLQSLLCLCRSPGSLQVLQHLPSKDKHRLPNIYGKKCQGNATGKMDF